MSTWELFKATRLLHSGIIKFREIDCELHKPGLYMAIPSNWIYIGKIEKQYMEKTIVCLKLSVEEIKQGDVILIQDGSSYYTQNIDEMRVKDVNVSTAKYEDEVSIKINCPISKQSNIYLRR